MLDIYDMSESDKLFFFKQNLQSFARNELNQRHPKNLSEAISMVEIIEDYSSAPRKTSPKKTATKSYGEWKNNSNYRFGGNFQNSPSGNFNNFRSGSKFTGAPRAPSPTKKPFTQGPCHLCQGPHFMAQCPQRQFLSTLASHDINLMAQTQERDNPRSNPNHEVEVEANVREEPLGVLQYLMCMRQVPVEPPKKEDRAKQEYDLIYVDVRINNQRAGQGHDRQGSYSQFHR